MKIICPAGIGDWSWMWSKLVSVKNEIDSVRVIDGAPRRTVPYVKACGVEDANYDIDFPEKDEISITRGNYQMILTVESHQGLMWHQRPTWEKIRSLGVPTLLLEANQHLEQGLPLHEWLPDLPTDYHYPLFVSDTDRASGRKKTLNAITGTPREAGHPMTEGPVVGFSCASYKGSDAWDTWGREQWVDFLTRIMALGWRPLAVGGGWDDLTYTVALELDLPHTVGKTSVTEMIAQMEYLDAYIGFSSGMNVIRTVLNKPAMALWPCNAKCDQKELSRSWVPPLMLESERYVASVWRPVNDVWPVAKRFLNTCGMELGPDSLVKAYPNRYNGSGVQDGIR
jgi:hypothetical protein